MGLVCLTVLGIPKETPGYRYQGISERNVFRLTDPPQVQVTNTEPPVILPKLFLTGITTILDRKTAMFRMQSPAKPGEPAKEESLMLAEGQRDGVIEVVSIDENAKEVRVRNSGTAMSLNFEKDGVKTASAAPPAMVPGGTMSPAPVAPALTPTGTNVSPAAAAVAAKLRSGLGRTLRLPNPTSPTTTPTPATVTPPPSPAAFGAPAAAAQTQAAGVVKQLTPEEEHLLRILEERAGQVAPQ